MPRWSPDAHGRLERAAMRLYSERGFDQTTVADIAELAGLTKRTFFRYFADKREVLFWGHDTLVELYADAIADAPATATPIDAVAHALQAGAELHEERRDVMAQRQAVIADNPDLQERELLKRATHASAMAEALRSRGVPEQTAILTAEAGTAVFKVAFARWMADGAKRGRLAALVQESLDQLKAGVTGG
jgi:AcrR family transcriptional regulator